MKKLINVESIIIFLLGIVISGFSVRAYIADANDITFSSTKSSFADKNIKTALDTLYEKSTHVMEKLDGSFTRSLYRGKYKTAALSEINLSRGNYYVFAVTTAAFSDSSTSNQETDYVLDYKFQFDNVDCQMLSGKVNTVSGIEKLNDKYSTQNFKDIVFKCSTESGGKISFIPCNYDDNVKTTIAILDVIKIN